MKIKKIFTTLFFCLFTIHYTNIQCVDWNKINRGYNTCNNIYYTLINIYQLGKLARNHFGNNKLLHDKNLFEAAPENVTKKIQSLAKKLKIQNSESIKVKYPKAPFANGGMAISDTIVLDKNFMEIDKSIELFTILHELSHTKYKHRIKNKITAILSPFAIHFGLKALNECASLILNKIFSKNIPNFLQYPLSFFKLVSNFALIKFIIQEKLESSLSRKRELQADSAAAKFGGPEATIGGMRLFGVLKLLLEDNNQIRNSCKNHPSLEDRIQNLKKIYEEQTSKN